MRRLTTRLITNAIVALGLLGAAAGAAPLIILVRAAQTAPASTDWIYLGTVADTAGTTSRWLGDTGFEFVDAAHGVVPTIGERIRLTTVSLIRRANARGKPFERDLVQGDTVGEFPPRTILRVLEIGRRPNSKAGDRWQCWVAVQR